MKINKEAEDKFKKLKSLMKPNKNKATAGLEASKDPKRFLEKMKEPNINGLKGIAF